MAFYSIFTTLSYYLVSDVYLYILALSNIKLFNIKWFNNMRK